MAAPAVDLIERRRPVRDRVVALLFDDRYAFDGMLIGVVLFFVGLLVSSFLGIPVRGAR